MKESKVNDRKKFFLRCRTNFWVPKEKAERLKEERTKRQVVEEAVVRKMPSFD
jgi:hypothetical protein